jgi:hypothetical protein
MKPSQSPTEGIYESDDNVDFQLKLKKTMKFRIKSTEVTKIILTPPHRELVSGL